MEPALLRARDPLPASRGLADQPWMDGSRGTGPSTPDVGTAEGYAPCRRDRAPVVLVPTGRDRGGEGLEGVWRVKRLITASVVALLSLSAVPAQAQVDEWRIMEQSRHRSGVHIETPTIEGNVDQVRFQAGYLRTTGYFRYSVSVSCNDGQTWTERGLARDRQNRYWLSRIFSLSDVPSNVACWARLDVKAVRALRGYKMFGAIWGHVYA